MSYVLETLGAMATRQEQACMACGSWQAFQQVRRTAMLHKNESDDSEERGL